MYIQQGKRKKKALPINQLEQVIIYGNPMAEVAVWRNLAAASVPVVMLASRGKPQVAMLGSGLAVTLSLRRLQHQLANNAQTATAMAAWFVQCKFLSYEVPLATLMERFSLTIPRYNTFKHHLEKSRQQLQSADTVGRVMGVEGYVANLWFALLAGILPERLTFRGRNRRPPLDPVNSLLSLAYTLLGSEIRQGVICDGFDPSLGFLHSPRPGREAVVLDFMELFRTGVDDFVLRWIDETPVEMQKFFYRQDVGCRLSKTTRPCFFQAWAQHRESWPRLNSAGKADRHASLREVISGQTALARQQMHTLENQI